MLIAELWSFCWNLVLLQYAKRSKKFHHEYNFISIQTLHTHLLLCSLRHLRTPTPKVRTIRNVLVWTDHQLDKSMKEKKKSWWKIINNLISYNYPKWNYFLQLMQKYHINLFVIFKHWFISECRQVTLENKSPR